MRFIKYFLFVSVCCSLIYYIPILSWNASAIGRLVMIKVLLPVYDWQSWSDRRCLINAWPSVNNRDEENVAVNYPDVIDENCAVCEDLVEIKRITKTTYNELHSAFLMRDLPVIISDSHEPWSKKTNELTRFIDFLQTLPKLMRSIPCNFVSNLLQRRRNKTPNVQRIVNQIEQMVAMDVKKWFLHFRNCEFNAVKASRAIMPLHKRPYYLSTHLPPFHSSWILLSNGYDDNEVVMKRLMVKDLVVVLQLCGDIEIMLKVNEACIGECAGHELHLREGEALVLVARMWNFYYRPSTIASGNKDFEQISITFIQEIDWD